MNYLTIENGEWRLLQGAKVLATAPLKNTPALKALLEKTLNAEGCLEFLPSINLTHPMNGGAPDGFNAWGAIDALTEAVIEVAPPTTRDEMLTVPFSATPPWAL